MDDEQATPPFYELVAKSQKGGVLYGKVIKMGKMRRMNTKGYTLLEMMIVIAIIGLLATLAIPNYIRARQTAQRDACISNLKQIQGAIQTWAIDAGAASNAIVTTADIVTNYLKSWPKEGTTDYPVPANIGAAPLCPNYEANTDHAL